MPRLLFFATCQKAITDKQDNNISLITVMAGLAVNPIGTVIKPESVASTQWYAVSMWLRLPEDEGKKYEQQITIMAPDGTTVNGLEFITVFEMASRAHHNSVQFPNFPIGQQGEYNVQLWLRKVTDEGQPWEMVSEYPIELTHPT